MEISDLIEIGKFGNRLTEDGFIKFKKKTEFSSLKLSVKDIFLIFTDHSVRYVTIDNQRSENGDYIKILEKDIIADVIDDGKVRVMLAPDDFDELIQETNFFPFYNYDVYFNKQIIGIVENYIENKMQNIFEIKLFEDQKEFMVPDVDNFVTEKNSEKQFIVLKNIEELLTL